MEQITTLKVHKSTKYELDKLKKESESYDRLISKMISETKNKKLKNELIESYKSLGKKDLEILKEWEAASKEIEE